MFKIRMFFLFIISMYQVEAQQITAQLLDLKTNDPIPYASIRIGINTGVISNEEGYFTINNSENIISTIDIFCLGYKTKSIDISALLEGDVTITMEEAVNELDVVYLNESKPNADSIVKKIRRNIRNNYSSNLIKHNFFYRETSYIDFKKLDFKVTKASQVKKKNLADANISLDSLSNAITNGNIVHFVDFKGDLYLKDQSNSKLDVIKATDLIDTNNNFTLDNVQEKAQHIILKYLDTTQTYKLKSGLFKIEDSLSLKNNNDSNKNQIHEFEIKDLKENTNDLLSKSYFYDGSFINNVIDSDLYKYTYVDMNYYDNELVYIIDFEPRRAKAKFSGRLYVTDENFAIIKSDFKFADGKRGEKLNLRLILGVKFIENLNSGTIIYNKTANSKYQPKYLKYDNGRYFYVNRPIKFIENSRAKNKISFNFKIEGDIRNKVELLFTGHSTLSLTAFSGFSQAEKVPYQLLNKYDPSIWQKEQVIEPLNEMKEFGGSTKN